MSLFFLLLLLLFEIVKHCDDSVASSARTEHLVVADHFGILKVNLGKWATVRGR